MEETKRSDAETPQDKSSSKDGSVKHVVRTGLPPGIDVDDWKDPGKDAPKAPTDNRS